jgi:catechol-2,3-dioxygenase
MRPIDRREFCRRTLLGLSGGSVALGGAMEAAMAEAARNKEPVALGIRSLRLQTHRLAELRAFYRDKLLFPIREESANSVTFQAGATSLTFAQAPESGGRPFYHFAFNIPENKLDSAKEWLAARTPLASDGKVYHFTHWNAHAVYFWDPAGNLGELIARHNLPNARGGAFRPDEILYASEIGLVVKDVPAAVKALKARLALPTYRAGSPAFEPLGDEHRLLIVVQEGRPWIDRASAIFPTTATLHGTQTAACDVAGHPYRIEVKPSELTWVSRPMHARVDLTDKGTLYD